MNTVVSTRYGQVEGEQIENLIVWKGIPYAKPPVGNLRFRPPQQPDEWDGVREATAFGPTAMQPDSDMMKFLGDSPGGSSEDCLYLNIWSPGADRKRRPVMLWIHGGAFMYGSGSSETYDGASFSQLGDVVVVSINYRLGIFGYLHLDEIGGETYKGSGNCGLLDQVAALKWVRDNIEAFGGDPENVTVFGESAGAMSIGALLAIPEAEGLFHKAIFQSGAANNVLPSQVATNIAERFLQKLDITQEEFHKLHELQADEILQAAEKIPPMSLGPVLDGEIVPIHPLQSLDSGAAKGVLFLIGTTEDEYRLFTFLDPTWRQLDDKGIEARFAATFGKRWEKINEQLQGKSLSQELYEQLMTWDVFTYPAIRLSEKRIEHGENVWMYRFDFKSTAFGGGLKSCHALELPFVWNTISNRRVASFTGDAPERFEIAEQMHLAWIAFAKNGNPSVSILPDWPEYNLETRSTMIFDIESKIKNDPSKAERLFWDNVTALKESH